MAVLPSHLAGLARSILVRHDNSLATRSEKPVASDNTQGIVIGCIVGVILAVLAILIIVFTIRRNKSDKKEWSGENPEELDDYGIESAGGAKGHRSSPSANADLARSLHAS